MSDKSVLTIKLEFSDEMKEAFDKLSKQLESIEQKLFVKVDCSQFTDDQINKLKNELDAEHGKVTTIAINVAGIPDEVRNRVKEYIDKPYKFKGDEQ